jgi:hypothetical protein
MEDVANATALGARVCIANSLFYLGFAWIFSKENDNNKFKQNA